MITKKKQVEILEDTIDIINQGWCTGELKKTTKKGDRHCTLGALATACQLDFYKYGEGKDEWEIAGDSYYTSTGRPVPRRVERGVKQFDQIELLLSSNIPQDGRYYGSVAGFNDRQKDKRTVVRWLQSVIDKIQGS